MAVLNFTLSEDAVAALREVLTCLNKFSDEVSLEAKKDQLLLSTLNSSKSAYACFTLATSRFCSRYQFEGTAQYREKFYCTLYTRALINIFRSRGGGDPSRDRERETSIDRCDVAIQDGPGVKSRFIVKLFFRNGITSEHRLSFEVAVPVRATFDKNEAVHHWKIPSRTLRQLMEHFGSGIDYLEVVSDGEHVNFIGTAEKTSADEVLKKPLHTSIAIEIEEFEDIEVDEQLRIVISVKDFRAIIQHAGLAGSSLSAKYSAPARPIQFAYQGDGINCEFLLMTVGERGNPAQKTKKGRAGSKAPQRPQQQLEAAAGSRRQSAAPSEPPEQPVAHSMPPPPAPPAASAARSGVARTSLFDLRPSQRPPPATMRSEGLFVDDETAWEPVREEDEDAEEEARLEWDHSNQPNQSFMHFGRPVAEENGEVDPTPASSEGLAPTQPLSDVRRLGLFYRE